jgi:hypothetical protein
MPYPLPFTLYPYTLDTLPTLYLRPIFENPEFDPLENVLSSRRKTHTQRRKQTPT